MRTIKVPESTEGNIYCYGTGMWFEGLFCFHSHNQTSAPMPWSRSLAQLPMSALSVCVGSAGILIFTHTHITSHAHAHSSAGNELSSIHHAAARALKSLFDMRVHTHTDRIFNWLPRGKIYDASFYLFLLRTHIM